jgi:hypothetical protein
MSRPQPRGLAELTGQAPVGWFGSARASATACGSALRATSPSVGAWCIRRKTTPMAGPQSSASSASTSAARKRSRNLASSSLTTGTAASKRRV